MHRVNNQPAFQFGARLNRQEFSKLVNDASTELGDNIIVVGSGAILGALSDKGLAEEMKMSRELDFIVKTKDEYDKVLGLWSEGIHYEQQFDLHMDPLTLNSLNPVPSKWHERL